MKKIISLFLVLSLVLSLALPVFAQDAAPSNLNSESSIAEFEAAFPADFSYETAYVDALGNEGNIKFDIKNSETFVEVYVNGVLTQRAYASPDSNVVLWTEYTGQTRAVQADSLRSCFYTDIVSDVAPDNQKSQIAVAPYAANFDPEEWAYLMTRPSNPMISGSKPCTIYYHNYDDEPDQNRYSGKKVAADAGTAVSVIVSVLAAFLTGGVTIGTIVVALGSAIVADVISKSITGTVCFSTQKILYAPVIDGINIFPDAYITKRWVVISDTVNKTETLELDNPEHSYNRGHDPYAIAANAQQAEVDSRS